MAVENLVYQGINRAPTDYVGVQACEELINMRPTQGGLCPVRDFGVKWANVDWEMVFVHHTSDGDKYIAVRKGPTSVWAELVESNPTFKFLEYTGLTSDPDTRKPILDNTHFAAAGNVILFSICDAAGGHLDNFSWIWKDGAYVKMEANIPNVSYSITAVSEVAETNMPDITSSTSDAEKIEYTENALNAIQENNPDICFGPIIIATAFKTTDGQTFWTQKWGTFDPIIQADASELYVDEDNTLPEYYQDFFSRHDGHGYFFCDMVHGKAAGAKVTLTFPRINTGQNLWNKDTSILQSVEVYTSRPVIYLDTATAVSGEGYYEDEYHAYMIILAQRKYEEMELGNQLLYLQASIPLTSLAEAEQKVELTFGGNTQVTEDTMRADAGATRRYGNVLSYNARFHFFGSVSRTEVGGSAFLQDQTGDLLSTKVILRYDGEEGSGLYVDNTVTSLRTGKAHLVIAPSIRVQEVITYARSGSTYYVKKYRMLPSSSYNYSYCDTGPYFEDDYSSSVSEWENVVGTKITVEEKTAINVSEQYNPFVFRVEHSYVAPAAVLDVQPQMSSSVDNSYGTYPLNVFTERGLYALIQGSANVLYGAFDPLSSLVAKKGVPLEMGTFFLSAGNLWLVSGRRLTLVSDALSRGPNKHVRACPGYKRLSGDQDGEITPVYDVSRFVSAVTFEHFTEGGGLSYNRIREELYVSNPAYSYTYVISIKYRQWYKLSQYIRQDESGSSVAFVHRWDMTSGLNDVVDFNVETGGRPTVHMQTRPFSMAYSYSHVHRIVAMARAALSGIGGGTTSDPDPDLLVAALYGSDDLHDWKLLAYAKRNGTTSSSGNSLVDHVLHISQIRTPSSSRSWRYYTVCIGGKVPALADNQHETELGPILVDYEPVVRRIG